MLKCPSINCDACVEVPVEGLQNPFEDTRRSVMRAQPSTIVHDAPWLLAIFGDTWRVSCTKHQFHVNKNSSRSVGWLKASWNSPCLYGVKYAYIIVRNIWQNFVQRILGHPVYINFFIIWYNIIHALYRVYKQCSSINIDYKSVHDTFWSVIENENKIW